MNSNSIDYKIFYKSLKPIYCEAVHDFVSFNSNGYNHIKYKRDGTWRTKDHQKQRLELLPIAIKLIGLTTTFQEFEKAIKNKVVKIENIEKSYDNKITYWGIIAIIDNRKIKVVLRRIGHSKIHFWSIIPSWNTSKKRDENLYKYL